MQSVVYATNRVALGPNGSLLLLLLVLLVVHHHHHHHHLLLLLLLLVRSLGRCRRRTQRRL